MSLLSEIGNLINDYDFDEICLLIETAYGSGWAIAARIIGGFIAGYAPGYSWLTILIKVYLITLFSIFEWRKDNGLKIKWRWIWQWNWSLKNIINLNVDLSKTNIEKHYHAEVNHEITKEWIESKNDQKDWLSNYKYVPELHVKSILEEQLFKRIVDRDSIIEEFKLSLTKAEKSVIKLIAETDDLKFRCAHQDFPFRFNDHPEWLDKYATFEQCASELKEAINEIKKTFKDYNNLNSLSEDAWQVISWQYLSVELVDILNARESFLLVFNQDYQNFVNRQAEQRAVRKILDPLTEASNVAVKAQFELRDRIEVLSSNSYYVHAGAGIGKSHFSNGIFYELQKKGHYAILLKGSAFSSTETDLFALLKEVLAINDSRPIKEFFKDLNAFGQRRSKRVVIIIDGLNETTYLTDSFSPIWANGLQAFSNEIECYNNLALVVTFRSSYLDRIGDDISKENLFELKGFHNQALRKSGLEAYKKHFKFNVIDQKEDYIFFESPLLLKIYSSTINPTRAEVVQVKLNNESYYNILEKFVAILATDLAKKLGRPSKTAILNAIDRSSSAFSKESNAYLKFDTFLEITDNKEIGEIFYSNSIACHLLEGEQLFMKEIFWDDDLEYIVHSFQEIGGFLLARKLLEEFPMSEDLVKSDFFKTNLRNSIRDYETNELNENVHQLATDMLKFLVIGYSNNGDPLFLQSWDQQIINYSWELVAENFGENEKDNLEGISNELLISKKAWLGLFETALTNIVNPKFELNIQFIGNKLRTIDLFLFDLTWTRFVYERSYDFEEFIYDFEHEISQLDFSQEDSEQLLRKLELSIWLLETTDHKLRDRATQLLLEFGTQRPKFIFDKTFEFAQLNRLYIFERLISISYGISLRNQNDNSFVTGIFKEYINKFYSLQFGNEPKAPTYHYVVIDSIKHMIDLAIFRGVFTLNEEDLEKLNNYQFNLSQDWIKPTKEQRDEFEGFDFHSRKPDPIGDDFTIYSIPRLLTDNTKLSEAVVSIYARIKEIGYRKLEFDHKDMTPEREFFYGNRRSPTKIDRLGKKYSWIAFFEYAGYLLVQGKLNVWTGKEDTGRESHYDRLSDVRIELSYPKPTVYRNRIFKIDLLKHRSGNPEWTKLEQYDNTKQVWQHSFDDGEYTLLLGDLSQKADKTYNTRSYVLIDSVFVKRDEIKDKIKLITNRNIDWNDGFYTSGDISNAYFGELYWADNIPIIKSHSESVPLEEIYEEDYEIKVWDTVPHGEYPTRAVGEIVKKTYNKRLILKVKSTIVYYSWETDSDVFPSYSDHIPAPGMGRSLNLRADPKNFQILDQNKKLAFRTCKYESADEKIEHKLNYIRTDLLKKYMEENGLILAYQIKQHSYEGVADTHDDFSDFRGMQYFFPDI
ncbi:MAG: hypothetical protein JXQ96_17695 [Cyclobacteriaceae bacterium]